MSDRPSVADRPPTPAVQPRPEPIPTNTPVPEPNTPTAEEPLVLPDSETGPAADADPLPDEPADTNREGAEPRQTREAEASREALRQTQGREIDTLANIAVKRAGSAASEKRQKGEDLTHGEEKLLETLELLDLTVRPIGTYISARQPNGIPLTSGPPILVDGKRVIAIDGASEDGTFQCKVERGADARDPVNIPREKFASAQLIAEKTAILSVFPEGSAERKLVEMHINMLEHGNATLEQLSPQSVNETIRNAAEDAGFPTVDVARGILTAMSPEERAVREYGIQRIVEGKNLLDYPTTVELFRELGLDITEDGLHGQIAKARAQLKKLEADGASIEDAAGARYQLKLLENAAKEFSDGKNPLASHFTRLEQGEINAEQSKQFIRALKSGDAKSILETALGDEWAGLPDKEKEKRLAMLHSFGGKTFNLFGIMGMLAFFGVAQIGEAFKKS